MSLRINTNVPSIFAQKHLSRNQERLTSTFDHLSSGMRITKAADDAAGLGVSERMRAQIRSLRQAMRNCNDGISVIQTAESSLGEIADNLMRMRQLAVQAASGVLQATERGFLATEFANLQSEIDRIANVAEFSGLQLSNGTVASLTVQVGINNTVANDQITLNLQNATTTALAVTAATAILTNETTSFASISVIDTALTSVNTSRSSYGAAQNAITSSLHNLESYTENLVAAESRIRDVDFAMETAELARNTVFQQAGIAILAQSNQTPQAALQLLQ
ncbi:MAG TPA: flagellin FliC [Deltaproteobacteria bacterium]|nr:flagellin FliC [Deltaproteobacteria bacterium]HCP48111.1 flagellin FliC [Deltaproteobacteria bacterium]